MSYKEWTAIVQLLGGAIVSIWLVLEVMGTGLGDGTTSGLAIKLLWALGAVIAFNIIGVIITTILVSIAQGEALKDEPADERDEKVDTRSSRIGYVVTSILAALTLIPLAMGVTPSLAVLMLFLAPFGGGLAHAAAQLIFYRLG